MNKLSKTTKLLIIVLAVALIAVVVVLIASLTGSTNESSASTTPPVNVTDYQQCVDAGYPVQDSYPTVCRTPNGQSFVNPNQKVNYP